MRLYITHDRAPARPRICHAPAPGQPAHARLPRRWSRVRMAVAMVSVAVSLVACKDLTGSAGLPAGTPNPNSYNTPAGARGMRTAAVLAFENALPQYALDVGQLTDELESNKTGAGAGVLIQNGTNVLDPLDERILPEGVTVTSYTDLQGVRTLGNQALGALAAYDTIAADTTSARVMRAELYAMEGYAEEMLAELFCSGVPLSTLDFQHDFTYAPSSTREQVQRDAIAKFDTALALAGDSVRIVNFAQVGRGRAYLELGAYQAAADDVTTVPDAYQYQLEVQWLPANYNDATQNIINSTATLSDTEGTRGLPYLSSADPRSADTVLLAAGSYDNYGSFYLGVPLTFPKKYSVALTNSYAPFVVASGVEARLIQAEAQLHGVQTGIGTWIDKLNALRATIGLPSIADPGSGNPAAQIDTLLTERAEWLYLTGHRQGDLRRSLREYSTIFHTPSQIYPTGPYTAPGAGTYGTDITAPIDPTESANPYFHGCIDRNP